MRAFHLLHALWVVAAIARPVEREASEWYEFHVLRTKSRRLSASLLNMLMTREGLQRKRETSKAFLSVLLFRQSNYHILEPRKRLRMQALPPLGKIPRSSDGASVEGAHIVFRVLRICSVTRYPRPLLSTLPKSG